MSHKETEPALRRNQVGEALSQVQPIHISYCNTVLWWEAHQTTSEVAPHSKILALCDSVFLLLAEAGIKHSNLPQFGPDSRPTLSMHVPHIAV